MSALVFAWVYGQSHGTENEQAGMASYLVEHREGILVITGQFPILSPTKSKREKRHMNLTKDPIFKSIMFALLVSYIALISQSVWAVKPGEESTGPQDTQFAWFTAVTFNSDTKE